MDYRAAMICSIIAEVYRDKKKRAKPFTPDDFMPKEEPEEMSSPEMREAIELMNKMLGGEEK